MNGIGALQIDGRIATPDDDDWQQARQAWNLAADPNPTAVAFVESIEDVDTFADIAAFNLCEDSAIKQQLLETLETRKRLQLFAASLKSEIEAQRLRRKLQGHLPDDHIVDN